MRLFSMLLACCSALAMGCSTPRAPTPAPAAALVGTWKVDLRPTPGAEPYFQEFVVTSVQGKSFTGTFYGTPVTNAHINTDWGAVRFVTFR